MLTELLDRFPAGYAHAVFAGSRWGVTVTASDDGRRRSVYAEQLGGDGVVSANVYVTDSGAHLRPCEMPAARVLAFLRGAEVAPTPPAGPPRGPR